MSSTVERGADLARMGTEEDRYKEVLGIMEDLKESKIREDAPRQCHFIPSELIRARLGSRNTRSTVALQYANISREVFNTILWVAADNTIVGQSFREIAKVLEVVENNDDEIHYSAAAVLKAKDWLRETPETLIRLTIRLQLEAHVQPFDDGTGSELLLSLLGFEVGLPSNQESARAITPTLGGLPPAISQIGGFISQRKLPLQDFLPLHERNSTKFDSRRTGVSDYEHTLGTVWEMSLTKLSGDSLKSLQLISLNQDADDLSLGDAEESLFHVALSDQNTEHAVISVHRFIHASAMRRLSEQERNHYFDIIVRMLSWGFPDTWSEDVGHQFQAWRRSDKCLHHINHLINQAKRYRIRSGNL
ncbi:hypothetical protein BJ875DRAFT_505544 [Amylocarpus encephaloides]|uniref:Uncharacterized protein n=1 Tax=Amylocarpus encephaloides TaxID=45428 RepID=A0A9P8C424_9HELO|nr:hypothetical protein BJ875DRAFT_505544 [Amylocarpus encephaloides]